MGAKELTEEEGPAPAMSRSTASGWTGGGDELPFAGLPRASCALGATAPSRSASLHPALYPGVEPSVLAPVSLAFRPTAGPARPAAMCRLLVGGRPRGRRNRPEGPGSDAYTRARPPWSTHVALDGRHPRPARRLGPGKAPPTEAEWESAALAAAWRARLARRATRATPARGPIANGGRASPVAQTRARRLGRGPRRSVSRRTASACSPCAATSGSGATLRLRPAPGSRADAVSACCVLEKRVAPELIPRQGHQGRVASLRTQLLPASGRPRASSRPLTPPRATSGSAASCGPERRRAEQRPPPGGRLRTRGSWPSRPRTPRR